MCREDGGTGLPLTDKIALPNVLVSATQRAEWIPAPLPYCQSVQSDCFPTGS